MCAKECFPSLIFSACYPRECCLRSFFCAGSALWFLLQCKARRCSTEIRGTVCAHVPRKIVGIGLRIRLRQLECGHPSYGGTLWQGVQALLVNVFVIP
jgi:hypothetical protein